MLQHVWLSPNPPWLTLAIIQSYYDQPKPSRVKIIQSYGNRQLSSFAFSSEECKVLLDLPILHNIKTKYENKGVVTVVCLGMKHNAVFPRLNRSLYNVMKVWNISK